MFQENNRTFILNENIEIRYDCLFQDCLKQDKCVPTCFIFSKISYIARMYQKIMSENVDANEHISWLTIKKHAKQVNNLNIWVKKDFFLQKPRPIYQKKDVLYHTGKGQDKASNIKCYFCFRKYAKQKIMPHVQTHRQMKIEKIKKQGKQSYQYFCQCLVCKKKMEIFLWAQHVLNAHRFDLVFICILLRKDNPVMYGRWYFQATKCIAQDFRPKFKAAVQRNMRYSLVQKMNKARKQYRYFGKPQQKIQLKSISQSQLDSQEVPNVEYKIDLPPPPQKPYDGDEIRQQRLRLKKEKKEVLKRQKIEAIENLEQNQMQKHILAATYAQFSRQKFMQYKLQYPRVRQCDLIYKILKQWEGKSKQQWFKLYQRYKKQVKNQDFLITCRIQNGVFINRMDNDGSSSQSEKHQLPNISPRREYSQDYSEHVPVRSELEIKVKFKNILIQDGVGGLRLQHPLQKSGRVFYVKAERDQFITHQQGFERYGGQFIRYHRDLQGHILGYYIKRLRGGQKARKICLQG